jgi:acyl-CoA synthetase (NDP forming)
VPDALRGDATRRTIPSFAFPEAAAHALGRAAELADWRRRPIGTVPKYADIDVDGARRLIDERLRSQPADEHGPGCWLDAADAARLLDCFAVPILVPHLVSSASEAGEVADALGYPVVLKAGAPELVHKSDVGGVALRLTDAAAVRAAFARMEDRLGNDLGGAIVQRMAAPGVETIVGVTQDPSFGPLVLFGSGGVTAELLADRTLRLVPMTDVDAHEVVRSLRGSPLLFGYRGQPEVDVAALEDLLLRVSHLADEIPEVNEMDLNPVIVSVTGAVAVDMKVRVRPADAALPPDLRRLRV